MSATDNPTTWREGCARLSSTNLPCESYRPEEWREVHASDAAGKEWTGIDLFGVQEKVGLSTVSACGALILSTTAAPAEEITSEFASGACGTSG